LKKGITYLTTMSDRKLGYVIICLFLVMLCVALAYCLYPLFSPPYMRIIAFEKIGNLRIDDQVRVKGTFSGIVKKVDWTKEKVLVTIQTKQPLTIHEGYSAVTMDAGVMGDRMLMIDNGPEKAPVINATDTLNGAFVLGISEAVGYAWRLHEVVDSLKDMTTLLLHGDRRHASLVTQTKDVIKTVDSLSRYVLRFASGVEDNISSSLDSIDNFVNQTSKFSQSVAVSAPEYLAMLDKQLAMAGRLVATIDTAIEVLGKKTAAMTNKDNILWQNDIERLNGDLVKAQKTVAGIQKEMLKFKTYLRLW
jgi:ABC-type transporter Mla subunit MlaD